MHNLNYELNTDGEKLAYHVESKLFGGLDWKRVEFALQSSGRGRSLCEYFQEIAAVHTTCRMVTAGRSLSADLHISDPLFVTQYKSHLQDVYLVSGQALDTLCRFGIRAVEASEESINETQRRALKSWARRCHVCCYMCGTELDFTENDPYASFTIEHIWPQSYGGNSCDENLLPACSKCNCRRKRDFATWGMISVQSLLVGIAPSDTGIESVEGPHRFALHYYAGRTLAKRRHLSLKSAFVRLGPWRDLRVNDEHDVGDFFNLANHQLNLHE